MVAKSERLKELEAKRRALIQEDEREKARLMVAAGLVVRHRLEPGAAFTEADKFMEHQRVRGIEAAELDRTLAREALETETAAERAAIDRAAYLEAERTGRWPDGSPFVRYGGPVAIPPAPPAAPEGETPAVPPADDVTPAP